LANDPESEHSPTSEAALNSEAHAVSSTGEIVNNPSPTQVSDAPCPRVAPSETTTSSITPHPALSSPSIVPHVTKSDAALPVAQADGDIVMQYTTSTSLDLQNNKESGAQGGAIGSAATVNVQKVDRDVVLRDTTSTSSQLRNDEEVPVWLSQMIAYLRGVSEDVAWQELVTEFVDFERRGPPHGVSLLGRHHIETI
jgi:hypothetical protein